MKETLSHQTMKELQNLKILAVGGKDPWPGLAFAVDKQVEDKEDLAEVSAF